MYSGDTDKPAGTALVEFKNKIESMFRLYALNEQQKIEILVGQLTGSALREVVSWPAKAKRDVKQVLKRLSTTFETKTLPELKMKLYMQKQHSGKSLRDYALSLQEMLKAICTVDKEEVINTDEALTVQLIEGALKESVKTQLCMLKIQMLGKTVMEFKEATITIVGKPTGLPKEYPEMTGATSPEKTQKPMDTVMQSAQNSSVDQLQMLTKQMEELAVGMATMQREMRQLVGQQTSSIE